MKNLSKYISIIAILANISTNIHAQGMSGSDLPLRTAKTLEISTQSVPTIKPTLFNPPGDPPPGDLTTDRKVFWVHGHGGGIGSWSRIAAATQTTQIPPVPGYSPRKITSHNMDYSGSPHSVSSAAAMLKTSIENVTATQTQEQKYRNVVVAHSLGGLVSQYVDYIYDTESEPADRSFYGLITVGTPSQGAVLAKNVYPFPQSKGDEFVKNAGIKLSAGYIAEAIEGNFFLDLFWNGAAIQKKVEDFINNYTDEIALLLLKDFNTTAALDLQPGSAVVNTLQSHTPEVTKRVAIHAQLENSDMIWKAYHYLKNPPNGELPFAADNAQSSVDKMNLNKAKYKVKADGWYNVQVNWENALENCWFTPVCKYYEEQRANAIYICNEWEKGLRWWNDANDKWRILCGDLTVSGTQTQQCFCRDFNNETQQYSPEYAVVTSNCTNTYGTPISQLCSMKSNFVAVDIETDGIVPESSQLALPGMTKDYQMVGDSHFQEVNSPRLKDPLNAIWDGNAGIFFRTDKR